MAYQSTGPRITDVAARLSIDAPAVTHKAQQLERQGLVSRSRDAADAPVSHDIQGHLDELDL